MDFKNIDWNKAVENTLADYEKTKNSATATERKEVDLTKYFTLALPDKENAGQRIFRILPLDTDGKWYDVIKFHNLKIGNRWQKLYDPAQDGEESPLNDMYKLLINGSQDDKKLANSYRSRDFYIVRGVERGKEHEGVKFWRFPKVGDGSGIMDKIQPLMKFMNNRTPGSGAFFNPVSGYDIVINVVRDTAKRYTKVSQIMFDNASPLSNDENQTTLWLNDERTWKDMFRKKPIEFLKVVAQGSEPIWDSETKTFVAKLDDAVSNNTQAYKPQELPTAYQVYTHSVDTTTPTPTSLGEEIEVDTKDLPF